jgi:hypothetical protein
MAGDVWIRGSGGVSVSDVAVHFLADELPFGDSGVGGSRMGAYHGGHGGEARVTTVDPAGTAAASK